MAATIPAPLQDKVAIVTGGSRGIGAGIAKVFAQHGCTHIAITYMSNRDAANETLEAIRDINSSIKTCAIAADVRDVDCGKKIVDQALKDLETDHIDVVVSNAALLNIQDWPPVENLDYKTWNDIVSKAKRTRDYDRR